MLNVVDAVVKKAYKDEREIQWMEIYAGEKADRVYGEYLPEETLKAIKEFSVAIKGPLTTPVGGGMRSLNVAIRQQFSSIRSKDLKKYLFAKITIRKTQRTNHTEKTV